MHRAILDFARRCYTDHLIEGRVIDVGALDVNGALSQVIPIDLRVDMQEGKGVDLVMPAEKLIDHFGHESWDHVVSADMLEHAENWRAVMRSMWGLIKPGGTLLLTMASIHKGRHAYPDDYWRFPMVDFLRLFGENQILATMSHRISIGAFVRKTHPLNLDIDPVEVP